MSTITAEWIPVSEAAALIGCTARTVLRLVEAGRIGKVEVTRRMYLVKRADCLVEAKNEPTLGRPRGS